MSDLVVAFEALRAKSADYTTLWNYYDGNQPLVYSSARLRDLFRDINARFSQNWCSVVVDTAMDRINLSRFVVAENETATQALNVLWESTEMTLDSDDAHLAALVTGEAFVIAWTNDDNGIDAYYNDPRMCHVQYDAERPRVVLWAAKWWQEADRTWRLTLYYPDHFEYYATAAADVPHEATQFAPLLPGEDVPEPFDAVVDWIALAANETGIVPVFHLRLNRRLIKGELTQSITELQDAINKLLADMLVSAEFGAFKQRYIISDADTGDLKNAPNEIWDLPAGDGVGQGTSAGEFSATELGNYYGAIDRLANAVGIISRTPRHYFYGQGGDPSGEALIAMEAPLNKKVTRHIERFSATWRAFAAFLLVLSGGGEIDPLTITAVFDPVQTVQPRTAAEIREINARTGIPLTTTLRAEGWTDAEIEQMRQDRQAERIAEADLATAYLAEARRRFDQGAEEQ